MFNRFILNICFSSIFDIFVISVIIFIWLSQSSCSWQSHSDFYRHLFGAVYLWKYSTIKKINNPKSSRPRPNSDKKWASCSRSRRSQWKSRTAAVTHRRWWWIMMTISNKKLNEMWNFNGKIRYHQQQPTATIITFIHSFIMCAVCSEIRTI